MNGILQASIKLLYLLITFLITTALLFWSAIVGSRSGATTFNTMTLSRATKQHLAEWSVTLHIQACCHNLHTFQIQVIMLNVVLMSVVGLNVAAPSKSINKPITGI